MSDQVNQKLNELYDTADIVKIIWTRRLRWAGPVERMDINAAKKI